MGDFNVHHYAWGCSYSDRYGNELLESIEENNLYLVNNGSPTLVFKNTKTVVDITLCSSEIINKIKWEVQKESLGSDHFPIHVELNVKNDKYINTSVRKWNCKRADWDKYKSVIEEKCEKIDNSTTEVSYSELLDWIDSAANSSIQINKVRNKTRRPMWFDNECLDLIKKRREIEAKYRNNANWENFMEYVLVDKIAPPGVSYNIDEDLNGYAEMENDLLSKPFTKWELEKTWNKRTDTAPGLNNIQYSMLRNLPEKGKQILLKIINKYWKRPELIDDWHINKVILLRKPNINRNEIDAYRPITLSSCIAKIKDRLIKRRLEWWLEHNKIFPRTQFGFRRKHSTMDNLSIFISDIYLAFSKNTYVVALFSDIKGAYDNVIPNILMDKLLKKIVLEMNDRKYERYLYKGLPQGGILSPLLYALYAYDLKKIWVPGTKILQYADDVVIYVERKTLKDALEIMTNNIDLYNLWLSKNGLTLSEEKSTIELIAIREAVRIAKMNKYKKTMILTDSLSCVNKLEKFMNTIEFEEKIYFEILNDIEIITGIGNNINIGWVQGHIGVEGNEKADELAKIASRRDGKKYGEKHRKEKEGITNYIMTVYRLNHGLKSLKMKKEVLLSPSVG
ncbi:uncharacterized protein LOC113378715 [Ctenocephalides felis]|uniref:uncharacterized protein LOC113378715 n=1 Tax=Ctenocephalides felis TaxID=7515 RepID=UPI000E6E4EC8|nr:uncharacterized protein LOC113378715 [Ctenocephalides felis]